MESACVATVRAVTWNTVGSSSPGDLEHIRDHQQQALRRRKRRAHRAGLEHPVNRADAPPSLCISDDAGDRAPEILFAFRRPTGSHHSAMGRTA